MIVWSARLLEARHGLTGYRRPHASRVQAREILDRVADKWSLYVIYQLSEGTKRFTEQEVQTCTTAVWA
ncbi:MAG TPA: hypothetical protein VM347_39870 [Nonomuraea sp.]|nr:hypothetical protein [Nonomuraea sp.]